MSWTAPRTWAAGELVTAALMNTHVRDNELETAPAKATTEGGIFAATGANAIAERVWVTDFVAATETTVSATYTDLTTPGPAVTVTTGTKAIVFIGGELYSTTGSTLATMSFAVSGATTVAASGSWAFGARMPAAGEIRVLGSRVTSFGMGGTNGALTAGSNTFTAKYANSGGTTWAATRAIGVLAL